MKKRLSILAISILLLTTYYLFVRYTGVGIPCVFYTVTHLKCPGCGITRMLVAMAQFKWIEAFRYNQYLFVTFFYLIYIVGNGLWKWLWGKKWILSKREKIVMSVYLVGLIVFGVVRNGLGW